MNALYRPNSSKPGGIALLFLMLCLPAFADHTPISPPIDRVPAIWLGPQELDPKQVGIGRQIADLEVRGIDGRSQRLYRTPGRRGTVIVVRDPGCPVSQRYRPRISALARQFGDQGFEFVFIYPNDELSNEERVEDARQLAIPGAFVDRGSFALAEALGVKSTGDVFVLDTEYRLRYRGAVDDQYGLGYTRDFPSRHYLRNALDALRNGDEIETPATAAPGCYIDADPAKDRQFQDLPGGQMISSAIRLLPRQELHS